MFFAVGYFGYYGGAAMEPIPVMKGSLSLPVSEVGNDAHNLIMIEGLADEGVKRGRPGMINFNLAGSWSGRIQGRCVPAFAGLRFSGLRVPALSEGG